MSDSQINTIRSRCVYVYGANPSVDVARVSGTSGNLGTISDSRRQAGAGITRVDRFATAAELGNISNVTVNYGRFNQNIESVSQASDTNNRRNFLYLTSGNIRAMTNTDMYDTFYDTAIDTLVNGSDQDGTYRVHSSTSLSGHTLISSSVVFRDTRANAGAYTAGGLIETRDQPTTITDYYLFRTNQGHQGTPSVSALPVFLRTDDDIQANSTSTLDTILTADMRYWATQKIRYNLNGSGQNRGTGMVNTRLNGSGVRRTRKVNNNDYRAQEVPNGSATTIATHFLRIQKI